MIKSVILNGRTIEYKLQYKMVKNINLRINMDGRVYVSANRFTSIKAIEGFMALKADLILKAIDKCKETERIKLTEYFTEEELKGEVTAFCEKVYPYYEKMGIQMPLIKFRKMVSRWGSCNKQKGIITFSTNLRFTPPDCVRYVIWHEFTHLIVPNHSKSFYKELEAVCPDWKRCRHIMKSIIISKERG